MPEEYLLKFSTSKLIILYDQTFGELLRDHGFPGYAFMFSYQRASKQSRSIRLREDIQSAQSQGLLDNHKRVYHMFEEEGFINTGTCISKGLRPQSF
jgi:hypothetical protein